MSSTKQATPLSPRPNKLGNYMVIGKTGVGKTTGMGLLMQTLLQANDTVKKDKPSVTQ
jgi:type IV secretory pathway VirB4 component